VTTTNNGFTLRPYQEAAVAAAMDALERKRNGIVVMPTGSGKSLILTEIADRSGGRTVILQPTKEILEQNVGKMLSYGLRDIGIYSASMNEKTIGTITFATIGTIIKRKEAFQKFSRVIVDECFPAGTQIDGVPIEKIRPGDMVTSYNHLLNRLEIKQVLRVSRRIYNGPFSVFYANGIQIKVTMNHPVFVVGKGYVPASELSTGDMLYVCTTNRYLSSMRQGTEETNVLKRKVESYSIQTEAKRSSILQSRMCAQILCLRPICPYAGKQSYAQLGNTSKNLSNSETYQSQATYTGRQRKGIDSAPTNAAGIAGKGVVGRVPSVDQSSEEFRLSALLQGRYSESTETYCDRSGWVFSRHTYKAIARQKAGHFSQVMRMDGAPIQQQEDSYGQGRGREGCYVYNLEVADNHNYFADGILVHNCHRVNSKGGQYEQFISHLGLPTVGLTATPYRMRNYSRDGEYVAESRILTRTRPRIFSEIIHVTQLQELFGAGYLCRLDYTNYHDYDSQQIKSTTTGQGFNDRSLELYNQAKGIPGKIAAEVLKSDAAHVLAFTPFVSESQEVVKQLRRQGVSCSTVSATTKKGDREALIFGFRSGRIRCVVNVGVLCLDEATEILTDSGWVGKDAMTYEHNVAAWKDDGTIEFSPAKFIVRRSRKTDERMVFAKGMAKDFRVTSNHRMIIEHGRSKSWRVVSAEETVGRSITIPISGQAQPRQISISHKAISPKKRRRREIALAYSYRKRGMEYDQSNSEAARTVSRNLSFVPKAPHELTLDECRFIGFWIGDGTLSPRCEFSQSMAYPFIIQWFDALLAKVGFAHSRNTRPGAVGQRDVVFWSIARGTGSREQARASGYYLVEPYLDKAGSPLLWGFNAEQFEALLEGFWMADGNHGDGVKPNGRGRFVVGTQKQLYDTLQAIGVCRGFSMTIHPRTRTRENPRHAKQYRLSWRRATRRQFLRERPRFEKVWRPEDVWCVTSSTGYIITRRNGRVAVVGNTTGFDFPELDCIILGRVTKSVSLYYQMVGRGIRPAPGKASCRLIDLTDNVERFGRIETFELFDRNGNGMWRLKSDVGPLTGVDVTTGSDLENIKHRRVAQPEANEGDILTFGKYRGEQVSDVPGGYLRWAAQNFDDGKWRS